MRGSGQRRAFLFAFLILTTLLVFGSVLGAAEKKPSAKDLVKQAEADQKADRWEAAREKLRSAAEQKPKDEKIAEALKVTEQYLADRSAVRAMTFCDQKELDKCEKEVKLAASYARTQRVQEAEAQLAARLTDIKDRWNRVQQMIAAGQLAEAALELDGFKPYPYLFPNLAAEKERVRQLRVKSFLDDAGKNVAAQRWDAAIESYSSALRMDAANNDAARGLESARQEKEAATAFQQAQNAFKSKGYLVAHEANQKAMRLYPARQEYQNLAKQISAEWVKVLMQEARTLSGNVENVKDNQRALENLEWVRRLDPRQAGSADEVRVVRTALHSIYIQKASDYQAVADNSRIGLSHLYFANAQQSNPAGEFAFAAKLREAGGLFARKRTIQVVVNVENLSPAAPSFAEVVSRRVRAMIDKMGLPDLKLRTLEEYQKNPAEDPQFVENRPDGKSPTAVLNVALLNYESESTGMDKPVEKPSKFISGQETVPNPTYQQIQAEFNKVNAALVKEKPKPGRATKEGYTAQNLTVLQQQLSSTPREISRERTAEYTYQEFQLTVRALVKMNLEIRDQIEKQLLGADNIQATDQRTGVEISGVRDKDVSNLMNRQARLPTAEQLLRDCEKKAVEAVDDKVRTLVTKYLQRFYNEGEKALGEDRTEDAIENFLCHWYSFRGRLDENQAKVIRDAVKSYTGFDLGRTM